MAISELVDEDEDLDEVEWKERTKAEARANCAEVAGKILRVKEDNC